MLKLPPPADQPCPTCPAPQICGSHLRSHCNYCSAALVTTVAPATLRKEVVVLRSLAAFHKFDMVQEMAEWMMQHIGGAS
jgi:hypothetical protein